MVMVYNDPAKGKPSSNGPQLQVAYFNKKAIDEVSREMYFTQLADITIMPKNTGKVIEQYVHIPILDDRNINDQGIDATGRTIKDGNLYGSSRDIGTVTKKMPVITENGQRVNRVGWTRQKIRGTLQNFGYFTEYSKDLVDFDSEADLMTWVYTEMVKTASEIVEDLIQIDLLNAAGIVKYSGSALSNATMNETSKVAYADIARAAVDLDNTRTPKNTKIITGSTKYETRPLNAARVMFVGPEIVQDLRKMTDYHGDPAFISVEKYADGGTLLRGEIGAIDQFRIVQVQDMLLWQGAGATVADEKGIHTTDGKADIFPMLVVGSEAFTTIGFNTSGKNTKFEIIHKKPGTENASFTDPYGKRGFMSIQWWYGFLVTRPERILVIKTTVSL